MDGRRAWPTRDYGEKSEKPLSSLLVFLNNWLNFRVRDQFEIKRLIARGHSDINTTPSVIISLFCCRSLCLCISLSRCLCLFILALSRSACRRSSLQFSLLPLALTLSTCRLSSPKFWSYSSTSNALSLAIVFACSTRVDSSSLLKTCRLDAVISLLFVLLFVGFRKL